MTNGPVNCRVRLDRGGYVPGEAISIWATITNNSRVVIKHTRASLTEVMCTPGGNITIFDKTTGNDGYSGDRYSGNDGYSGLNPLDDAILFTVSGITAIADKKCGDFD